MRLLLSRAVARESVGSYSFFLVLILLIAPFSVLASPQDRKQEEVTDSQDVVSDSQNQEKTATQDTAADQDRGALEKRLDAQEAENRRLAAKMEKQEQQIHALNDRLDAQEEEDFEEFGAEMDAFKPSFLVYGFFDLNLMKYFVADDEPAAGGLPTALSFTMTNLNIYFYSEIHSDVSALVELRFTFLPHATDNFSMSPVGGLSYERVDTTTSDPFSNEPSVLGSVIIERALVKWQSWDYFGVTAGRYITPYGIWNEDHSSTVLLPVIRPYLTVEQIMPPAQTGIKIHGKFFLGGSHTFKYEVTLSNGRGPTEAMFDLEDNKALGLRLKYIGEWNNAKLAIGGYGYWGNTTDITKEINITDPTSIFIDEVTTSSYRDLIGAADFLLQLFGIRVQAEYVFRSVKYDERPIRTITKINIPDPAQEYRPNYTAHGAYVLLGYELPLRRWIGSVLITPYVMGERTVPDDTEPDLHMWAYRLGINIKPIPAVVLKIDASNFAFTDSEIIHEAMWAVAGQVAVSF